jgi:hypothetical protein
MAVRKGGFIDFRAAQPIGLNNLYTGPAIQTSAAAQKDVYTANGITLFFGQIGACGASLGPNYTALAASAAGGWTLPVPATNSIGCVVDPCNVSDATAPFCFTVGTDAAFYMSATFSITTAANTLITGCGFRTAGTLDATTADWTVANLTAASGTPYADLIMVNSQAGECYTSFKTNSAGGVSTDTTVAEVNATAVTYMVKVSAAGVVTCYRNGALTTAGSAPGTLTSAIVVSPFFFHNNAAASTSAVILQSMSWGLQ